MLGIVLAAGDATRLPHKSMLVTPDWGPLIADSVGYCLKHKCEKVIVVCREGSIVDQFICRHLQRDWNIQKVYQECATGVVDAIALCRPRIDFVVTFADCYGYEKLPLPPMNKATVMLSALDQLDGWDDGWVKRDKNPKHKFLGAFRSDCWAPVSECLMKEFMRHEIKPHECLPNTIIDCGTEKGYKLIWPEC